MDTTIENLQTLIAEHVTDSLILLAPDRTLLYINPAARNWLGLSPNALAPRYLNDHINYQHAGKIVPPDEWPFYRVNATQAAEHGTDDQFIIAGKTRPIEWTCVPVPGNQNAGGCLLIWRDASGHEQILKELAQAQEAAESANHAKGAFLATMSHEIRTPMNGVIGMTSLLLETPLTRQQRDFVETIRHSGDALLTLINDILDYSKIESGRLELENQPFSLRECIESALDLLSANASEKSLELAYLMEPNVPEGIFGDMTRLRQTLVNLVNNAIKFTEKGEVIVTVTQSQPKTETDSLTLHFSVRDTGIGISPERAASLFQSFSQLDNSFARKYGGSGLGLAICQRLVEMMGGRIWVESTGLAGEGSIFHFTLPTRVSEKWTSTQPPTVLPPLTGKRVLLVDDNDTNLTILTHMTRSWGMVPAAFKNGKDALALFELGQVFDLAILDMLMPEMNGLMLTAEIRKHHDATHLPIIILSSLGHVEKGFDALAIAAFLHKPIKSSQLFNALATIFAQQPIHAAPIVETPTDSNDNTPLGKKRPLTILLAEDHPVNQKVALMLLERLGYRADVAANGLEVIQAFQLQRYDVVLMDIQMPEMDGLAATSYLRKNLPADQQPRIIAVTANALEGDREEYLAAGMDDYVSKPVQIAALQKALAKASSRADSPTPESTPAATATQAGASVIDTQYLDEYFPDRHTDASMLREMLQMFFDDSESRLADLHQAVAHADATQVRATAHALKGASLMFGAVKLSELCKEMELLGKLGNLEHAAPTDTLIETAYRRAKDELLRLTS